MLILIPTTASGIEKYSKQGSKRLQRYQIPSLRLHSPKICSLKLWSKKLFGFLGGYQSIFFTSTNNKLARTAVLHTCWRQQNIEKSVKGDDLIKRQRDQCKEVQIILFGFALNETQVDAIYTIFSNQKALLLFTQTDFGKSLIFQLISFKMDPIGLIFFLIPLKFLKAKQNTVIN